MKYSLLIILLILGFGQCQILISIEQFGAIPNNETLAAYQANSLAIKTGFYTLNSSDNILYVPRNKKYYIQNITIENIHQFTFKIDGSLIASKDVATWPKNDDRHKYYNIFEINECSFLTFTGQGEIQGNGYNWWLGTFLNLHNLQNMARPQLITLTSCDNILIEYVSLLNSPRYHIEADSVVNMTVRHLKIWVDIEAQKDLYMQYGNPFKNISNLNLSFPVFPLNTDGIDPNGRGFHFYNLTIKNYDDAVAVKPGNINGGGLGCTQDILVENITVINGVGMSIGSVPPHDEINCIRNVMFRNIYFLYPIKGIYIKSNSGQINGTGLIQNITYTNLFMNETLWYPIYIGPQQQKQPGGGGDGWWPPTNPRVTIKDIFLTNVTSIKGVFAIRGAGVLRCNVTNPCRNFDFNNVHIDGIATKKFVCSSIYGQCNDCQPIPDCFQQQTDDKSVRIFEPDKFMTKEEQIEEILQLTKIFFDHAIAENDDEQIAHYYNQQYGFSQQL